MTCGTLLTAHDKDFREDPYAIYDRLRDISPIFADHAYARLLLTRHADARQVLRGKEFGVDARRANPDSYTRRIAGTGILEGHGSTAYEPPLVLLDDPAHRRIRSLMAKAFNPGSIAAMRERIEETASALLDLLRAGTEVDFIEAYAGPLPTRVIAGMMGLPIERCADLKRWSDDILRGYDPERDAAAQERLRRAYVSMSELFLETVASRRTQPGADLISAMVRAQEHEDRLSELEIISLCTQLMVAGNVTTTDLLGNGLHALLHHPHQLAKLRAQPGLVAAAIEEILRYDCPLTETARIAYAETMVGGCPVHQGATLTVSLAAANYDPDVFADPHRFDIERQDNPHMAFGNGIHVCLGAALARLEGEIGLMAFLKRFPGVALAKQPPKRRDLPFFRGFESLPVQL